MQKHREDAPPLSRLPLDTTSFKHVDGSCTQKRPVDL